MNGIISYALLNKDTGVIEQSIVQNTVVSSVTSLFGQFLVDGTTTLKGIKYLSIGTSQVIFQEEKDITNVIREVFRTEYFEKKYLQANVNNVLEETDNKTNIISFRFKMDIYEPNVDLSITEFGLYTAESKLVAYKFFNRPYDEIPILPITKNINHVLMVDWVIVLSPMIGSRVTTDYIYTGFWASKEIYSVDFSVKSVSLDNTELTIEWSRTDQIIVAGYNIYRRDYFNNVYSKIKALYVDTGIIDTVYQHPNSYADVDTERGKLYFYKVIPFGVSGLECDDDTELLTVNLKVTAIGGANQVSLFWDVVDEDGFHYFNVYRKIGKRYEKLIETEDITYVVENLESEHNYSFVVSVVDINGVETNMSYVVTATTT